MQSEIKFDKSFIKNLLDKLKVGNARTIHLNSLPGRSAARLDLAELSHIDENMASNFLDAILSKEAFSFSVNFDKVDLGEIDENQKKKLSLIAKRLNNLVIENTDNFLEYGLKNFGLGYPILIKRDKKDPSRIIKAPLFIWHLDIERSYQNKNTWTIKKEEEMPIKINELLIAHLSNDEGIQIKKISKEKLEDGILDKNEILYLTKDILMQLNSEVGDLTPKVEKCPDSQLVENIANSKPWVQWSGIFGIYRSQNETIINATEDLLDRFDEFESENLVLEQFQTSSVTAVETDPSKEEIVNTLTNDEFKLIQGPPGTGKSQSITAIVSNALANEATCLIVCEKKTALDVIQANLEKIGLDSFSIVIDDVHKDRKKVIEKARNIKDASRPSWFSYAEFHSKYKHFCELKQSVNSKSAEVLKKVIGDYSWKEIIGLYLKHSKSGRLDVLSSGLDYKLLKFNHEEYRSLLSIVEEAELLYSDTKKGSEELFSIFDKNLFDEQFKWARYEKVKSATDEFQILIKAANSFLSDKNQSNFEVKEVSIFKQNSIEKCEPLIVSAIKNLQDVCALYDKGIKLGGGNFKEKGYWKNVRTNITAVFSSKKKEINKIRARFPLLLKSAISDISEIQRFSFTDLELKKFNEYKDLEKLKMDAIKKLVTLKEIETKIQKIKETEKELKKLDRNMIKISESKVFNIKNENFQQLGNYKEIKEFYEALELKIGKIHKALDAYESYHNWKYFLSKRNKFELRILSVIKNLPIGIWKNLFIAWYFRGALLHYENNTETGFNKSDSQLKQLTILYNELSREQLKQIKAIWSNKRSSKISSFGHNFNTVYNFRKNNSGPKNSLRKIIDIDFELFTTLFPVILTNPAAANAILPLKAGLFNVVIFDEASQLRIADTFTSLIRGQYKIIAGDEHQMPPSNYFLSTAETLNLDDDDDDNEVFSDSDEQEVLAESESLLKYAEDLKNINKSYLDFHYRSNHPALIQFSNSAFYGENLIPFPEREVYKPIEFRPVNGRYETRTNPSEVAEILKILREEIHQDSKGKYPSVGIATFNINQRNLITESLNESAEKDPDFAKKLQELRVQGLFVKNLENIQGDEKDIIIISTTYGVKLDGSFSQNFARLNRIEGYKLLNVLITRAKNKVYICTSIPKEKYLTYPDLIKNEGNNKKGILYAYLAYAEAISNKDTGAADYILKTLKEQTLEKPRVNSSIDDLSESPFEEEVYDLLIQHFKKEKIIQQHKVGGFRLDFVIKTNNNDIVLECDGKAYHQTEEAYAYDMYRQKELEQLGFKVYRIWSTNWFQDKEIEMQKLIAYTKNLNSKHPTSNQ